MELFVKDPSTGALLRFEARPERLGSDQGFHIINAMGNGFFIASKFGAWRVVDGHHVEPELLTNIGLALEGRPLKEQL
ncbi:hypothetical protein [Mucilaginibacter sp. BT774]|uniref:hypothetical protein n=1 Tax=Mucilaginibacter sp. BT774 TaxID=3062276 RepID=UPI002676EBFB|nr:hypothetical protein [Mucilaginibacter sp. BT774]MDO3628384.1 hypothetical protein [Mucilaginibacter sp. BT774]